MAHAIENVNGKDCMFYVGETPWHGLGQKLDENPSISEAMVAASLDWEVGLKDLFTSEGTPVPARATYRKTDGSILGVVGPRYTPLQNSDAFDWFQPFLDANECSLHTAGSLHEGQKVWVLAKLNRDNCEIVPGDTVQKFILLSNSHDGTVGVGVLDSYCLENGNKFVHITYPYTCNEEIHGFERKAMAAFCKTDYVDYVARGGFFGGHRQRINELNALYYGVLNDTMSKNLMGADECLFTILCHQHSDKIHRFNIDGNGLVWPFFEMLKHYVPADNLFDPDKIALYVITYNSPEQFEALIQTYLKHKDFITNTENYLLDNSTDKSTEARYEELCEKYKFTRITRNNIGICGGRQFIAEHFAGIDAKYYIFLEDDMNLVDPNVTGTCSSGFARFTPNLLQKVKAIMEKENYDFLKFSFKEFFGDNSTQWAWYNIPQRVRDEVFPEKNVLPEHGFDPNAPKLTFKSIKNIDGLAYADGEVYYCNWPQIVSKAGNQKLFLDTKWNHPYEQTWMSHFFQETRKGLIHGAVLLLSPVEHHRFKHYPREERREN